jgi:hypothetical protein
MPPNFPANLAADLAFAGCGRRLSGTTSAAEPVEPTRRSREHRTRVRRVEADSGAGRIQIVKKLDSWATPRHDELASRL